MSKEEKVVLSRNRQQDEQRCGRKKGKSMNHYGRRNVEHSPELEKRSCKVLFTVKAISERAKRLSSRWACRRSRGWLNLKKTVVPSRRTLIAGKNPREFCTSKVALRGLRRVLGAFTGG